MKSLLRIGLFSCFMYPLACKSLTEIPIVVVIPSYNNHEWTAGTLASVLEQEYDNMRVIFIDDASTDKNYAIATDVVARYHAESRVQLVRNKERCGALANTYVAIHSCADDELWIVLDGDDRFPHKHVLAIFNEQYQKHVAWASFGQYIDWPVGNIGHAEPFPDEVIRENRLRSYRLPSRRGLLPITAPRTGYAWLFKLIRLQDLLYDDYYYIMAGDYAYMVPVLELAGFHGIFIPDILYVYNIRNPINDARVDARLQGRLALHILSKKPYQPVMAPVPFETSQDTVSMILLSEKNAAQLSSSLYAILRFVRPISGITVMYVADEEHKRAYKELADIFPTMRWIPVHAHEVVNVLQKEIDALPSKFVLLSDDHVALDADIAVAHDILMLKKTHASILYNGLGADNAEELFAVKRLPPVNLSHTYYGWYCDNKTGNWQLPVMTMTLWEKGFLQQMIHAMSNCTMSELKVLFADELQRSHVLGLIHDQARVTIQE